VERLCHASEFSRVTDGRFKGGWTTRRYGEPASGVHAIQMELACRAYMDEAAAPAEATWPTPYDPQRAAALRALLADILQACLEFGRR
jgi:formiminoglutamase